MPSKMVVCPSCGWHIPATRTKCSHCGTSLSDAIPVPPPPDQPNRPDVYARPVPKCPTCGSELLKRFSKGGKIGKIAAFGVFGLGNVRKTFECLNCHYKW